MFGESHGVCVGVLMDSPPPNEYIDTVVLSEFLARRSSRNSLTTPRQEKDDLEFLSGIKDGKTNGYPLCVISRNMDVRKDDYEGYNFTPRPGHADYTAILKYGENADISGGGYFSGRMTLPICIAGGIALQILERRGIKITAKLIYPDEQTIHTVKADEDSIGGLVNCVISRVPGGIGGPLFDGLEGKIAYNIYGIPGVKGVQFGNGFDCVNMKGSQNNDAFCTDGVKIFTKTNNCGGILGGISTGGDIVFDVAFKPTPSIAKTQNTVNLQTKENCEISVKGRHDPCIALRAVPVVEAVSALVILDELYM